MEFEFKMTESQDDIDLATYQGCNNIHSSFKHVLI